jgi:hypothetical protein
MICNDSIIVKIIGEVFEVNVVALADEGPREIGNMDKAGQRYRPGNAAHQRR